MQSAGVQYSSHGNSFTEGQLLSISNSEELPHKCKCVIHVHHSFPYPSLFGKLGFGLVPTLQQFARHWLRY